MSEKTTSDRPFKVYGINLLVRVLREAPDTLTVHCPRGASIRYGQVIVAGDGFDEGSNSFREMPPTQAIIAFEEASEGVEGHYSTATTMSTASCRWIRSSSPSRSHSA